MAAMKVGIDLAKSVFQVHGVDSGGRTIVRRRLSRDRLSDVFTQTAALSDRHGGLRALASLGSRARAPRT